MADKARSKFVVYAALAGNVLVALTKFAAAAFTGSAAMLSEAVHSSVDTGNEGLMLYGMARAGKPADEQHPMGYGRELYFWTFIVALLIFALGAGVSFYEGISRIAHPAPIENPLANYVVLALSALFEGTTWLISWRAFKRERGRRNVVDAAVRSRDPTSFLVLFEDSAALIGIAIAAAGTFGAERLQVPQLDGVASLAIGFLLAATAGFLARESKGLLIGELAETGTRKSIADLARRQPGVTDIKRLVTVHLAPDQIVAALDVDFKDDIRASEVERTSMALSERIREKHPDVTEVFVNPVRGRGATPNAAVVSPEASGS